MALHHAEPGEVVDLRPLGDALTTARTAALVKTDRFEAARLVIPAGTDIPRHAVAGYTILHCLEGRVALQARSDIELGAGDWVHLDRGEPHALRGIEDASLLLTILFDD